MNKNELIPEPPSVFWASKPLCLLRDYAWRMSPVFSDYLRLQRLYQSHTL